MLLLWLDCDLEGENIAYEVIDIASAHNKRLDIYRAKFSALIPRDIFRTLQHPERPNKHMSDAVDARQEIDLRLGAAFTRFQTMRLQGKCHQLWSLPVPHPGICGRALPEDSKFRVRGLLDYQLRAGDARPGREERSAADVVPVGETPAVRPLGVFAAV